MQSGQLAAVLLACPAAAAQAPLSGRDSIRSLMAAGDYPAAERALQKEIERSPDWVEPYKCTSCGICVKVCPHGALAESSYFEFAGYDRFAPMHLSKEDLARAPQYEKAREKPPAMRDETHTPV